MFKKGRFLYTSTRRLGSSGRHSRPPATPFAAPHRDRNPIRNRKFPLSASPRARNPIRNRTTSTSRQVSAQPTRAAPRSRGRARQRTPQSHPSEIGPIRNRSDAAGQRRIRLRGRFGIGTGVPWSKLSQGARPCVSAANRQPRGDSSEAGVKRGGSVLGRP